MFRRYRLHETTTRQLTSVAVVAATLFYTSALSAYEVQTHRAISSAAVGRSIISNTAVLARLGLRPLTVDDPSQTFPTGPLTPDGSLTIRNLIRFGSGWEDDRAIAQALRHFYDPIYDRALDLTETVGTTLSVKSPDWALEDRGTYSFPTSQSYSYRDARQYFYEALTSATSESFRRRQFGLTFQTLGHVIHHLQDMAQPQHTRNDPHCDKWMCKQLAGLTRSSRLYVPSQYEDYTDSDDATRPFSVIRPNLPFNGVGSEPVYPGVDLATNAFKLPRHFWRTTNPGPDTTAGKGIAEFTNRNFFSAGSVTSYASPPPPQGFTQFHMPSETREIGELLPGTTLTGKVRFWGSEITDALSDGPAAFNTRALSEGLVDSDLVRFHSTNAPGELVYALNRFTYDAAHQFLIPRAVAYSAGLINYFFRGQLEISAPEEGVYGAVDHAIQNQRNSGGFERIKVKIRNTTPAGTGPNGEALFEPIPPIGGSLVAVVKFHRNFCYQPNLSGEYGSPGIDWQFCRSPNEDILVSEPITDLSGINEQARTLTFRFPVKIPIEATDLYLQVVYRGPLGEEPDAVVVATKDISEPTYLHQFVTLDQYLYCHNGVTSSSPPCAQELTFEQSHCDDLKPELSYPQCRAHFGVALKFRANPTPSPLPGYDPANPAVPPGEWFAMSNEPPFVPVALMPPPVGSIARVAVLTDLVPRDPVLHVLEQGVNGAAWRFQWYDDTIEPTINQLDPVSGSMVINRTYAMARGVYVVSTPFPSNPAISPYVLLSSGNAPNISNMTVVPSQITF